jgi:enoyl-CoA hydratase
MGNSGMVARRSILKAAAAFGGLSAFAVIAPAVSSATQEREISAAASPEVKLEDVLASPNTKLTIERRGQVVLIGINRPYIQNRIDPETFEKLAEAYYQYDYDPSLRAEILFGLAHLSIVPVVFPAEKGKYFTKSSLAKERILN